jgi:hypothetical protein
MAASIQINNPTNNAQYNNGDTVSARGTFAPAGAGSQTRVMLSLVFSDANENEQQIALTPNIDQVAGTWTASFTMPLFDWNYLFSAMAGNPADGTRDRKDRHLVQGNPP